MPDAASLPSVRELALADLMRQLDTTRTVLERIPGDRIDWRPHEKSYSIGELGVHLANLVGWQKSMLESDEFDLAARGPNRTAPPDTETLLEEYDRNVSALEEAFADADDEQLMAPWTLRNGDEVVFRLPRAAAIRNAGISHMIHHRGQLTVYLRLLDVPVPPTFGPTADES